MSPKRHNLRAKSFGLQAPATRCRCLVTPKCRVLHGPDFRRPACRQRMASRRPNLQFDILLDGDFRHDAAASLSAQRPVPAVVVRFVRALQTACSRGRGLPRPAQPSVHIEPSMDSRDLGSCARQEHDSLHQQTNSRPLHGSALDRMGRCQSCRLLVGRPHRRQPLFGFIKEGVNLLRVVASS
jgi:hypothetical protein